MVFLSFLTFQQSRCFFNLLPLFPQTFPQTFPQLRPRNFQDFWNSLETNNLAAPPPNADTENFRPLSRQINEIGRRSTRCRPAVEYEIGKTGQGSQCRIDAVRRRCSMPVGRGPGQGPGPRQQTPQYPMRRNSNGQRRSRRRGKRLDGRKYGGHRSRPDRMQNGFPARRYPDQGLDLIPVGGKNRKVPGLGPIFEAIDFPYSFAGPRITGQSVEGLGRHQQDASGIETLPDAIPLGIDIVSEKKRHRSHRSRKPVASSSTAWARAASVTASPATMREISSIRWSPDRRDTVVIVRPACVFFSTRN